MVDKVECSFCRALILPDTTQATGGLCMKCKKRGKPPKRSLIVHRAYEKPARCLSKIFVMPDGPVVEKRKKNIKWIQFQLGCECGGWGFIIQGHPMESSECPDQYFFSAPLSIRCEICRRHKLLFDPRIDGYTGEIEAFVGETGSDETSDYACSKCGHAVWEPAVSLEYSIEDGRMNEWEELAAKPQDFFTYFSLYGKCRGCGTISDITDYKCS